MCFSPQLRDILDCKVMCEQKHTLSPSLMVPLAHLVPIAYGSPCVPCPHRAVYPTEVPWPAASISNALARYIAGKRTSLDIQPDFQICVCGGGDRGPWSDPLPPPQKGAQLTSDRNPPDTPSSHGSSAGACVKGPSHFEGGGVHRGREGGREGVWCCGHVVYTTLHACHLSGDRLCCGRGCY